MSGGAQEPGGKKLKGQSLLNRRRVGSGSEGRRLARLVTRIKEFSVSASQRGPKGSPGGEKKLKSGKEGPEKPSCPALQRVGFTRQAGV